MFTIAPTVPTDVLACVMVRVRHPWALLRCCHATHCITKNAWARAIWCLTWYRDTATLRLLGDTPALRILLRQLRASSVRVDIASLNAACSRGMLEAARLLLEACTNSDTPMNLAAMRGHTEVVKLLLTRALPDGLSPLHQACLNGHVEVARLLLDAGAPHSPFDLYSGQTPLHQACKAGHADVAALLLEVGALPEQHSLNSTGHTALHSAAHNGRIELVQLLLAGGANPSSTCGAAGRSTPLHVACEGKCPSEKSAAIVSLLLGAGADVTLGDDTDVTPLHVACSAGLEHCAEALIRAGACTDAVDQAGLTPLHGAPPKIVKLLLDAGSSPNARTHQGITPLHSACNKCYAFEKQRVKTIGLLLAAGADVGAMSTNRRNTPLHMAAYWRGSIEVVDALLAAGADPRATTVDGRMPGNVAKEHSDARVIARLR